VNFVHADRDFSDLLAQVASLRGLSTGLIEKDYWVTHALWGLHLQGFDVWFKGGTSLSKGFGLIQRFSEDLDMKVEPGRVSLSAVSDWKSEGKKATAAREHFFDEFVRTLAISDLRFELEPSPDGSWRAANVRAYYNGSYLAELEPLRPYVLLEIGSARVTPYVERDITSFVHEELKTREQLAEFTDNRPRNVRCVHPLVTLVEKLDALRHKVPNASCEASGFVRHFEDSARIIQAEEELPPLGEGYPDVRILAQEMLAQKQIRELAGPANEAFALADGERTDSIRGAFRAIGGLYWGPRMTLDDACRSIRDWLGERFPQAGGT
jgi:Nucleotidyl transferase AbiEii toxin, Type IV TA system